MADFPVSLNDVSRVQKANALKSKLKKILKTADQPRTGEIKEEVFIALLQEHGISLEQEDVQRIKSRFSRAGKVQYLNILARIAPDLTSHVQQKWVFRVGDTAKSSVRDFLQSRSTLSRPIGSRGGAGVAGLQYLNVSGLTPGEKRSQSLIPEPSRAKRGDGKVHHKERTLEQIRSTSEFPKIDEHKARLNQPSAKDGALSPADISKILEFPFAGKGKKMVKMFRKDITQEEKEKQLQQGFLYFHELNYDVITNKYFDWNSPEQYKTNGEYKPKYSDDYVNMSLLSEDELAKEAGGGKKNTKIAMYLAAKHKNNPQFFTQLQEAARNEAVVGLVNRMMRSLIDPRQIINLKKLFLKYDKESKGILEQREFRKLYQSSVTKYDEGLESDLIEIIKNEEGMIDFQKLLYFVDLYQFFPYIVKKDRNFSADLYEVLAGGLQPGKTEQLNKVEKEDGSDLNQLLELLWVKIDERFPKIGNAFRYFDTNSNGLISQSEFLVGMENLHVNLQRQEIAKIFMHMDKDKDGYISYNEFCELLQEKRRGLDHFRSSPMSLTSHGRFGTSLEPKRLSIGDDASSFMESMGRNPNLNSSDILVSKKLQNYKNRRNLPKTLLPSKMDSSFTYGVPTLRPDNISDVMQFNYQKDWLEKLKSIEKQQDQQRQAAQKAKGLKQVDTRASKLRNQAQLNRIREQEKNQIHWEDKLNWKIPKYKNVKPTQALVHQLSGNADFKSQSHGSKPWLSKKMALLKESVPSNEYQTHAYMGGVVRDDLTGQNQKSGGGKEYIKELQRASELAKAQNDKLERSVEVGKLQGGYGAGNREEAHLLDRNMLKELEQGNQRAIREVKRDKESMLNEYFYNKRALGRIGTAQSGGGNQRVSALH